MVKIISLSLCLLIALLLTSTPAQAKMTTDSTAFPTALIAQQSITQSIPQIAAQPPTAAQATLTLADLPPGFTALPPGITNAIASRLDTLKQQLGQENLKQDNFFAFVNPRNLQLVLGFTGKFPDQVAQGSFDTTLKQLQRPETQQQLIAQLEEKLQTLARIKLTDFSTLPEFNTRANSSTGMSLGLEIQGRPLRLDFTAFRRNSVGAFAGVMYGIGKQPAIALDDVAQKLDSRIVELSAEAL